MVQIVKRLKRKREKKAEAPKVSEEEARKRFERLVNSDNQNPSKGL